MTNEDQVKLLLNRITDDIKNEVRKIRTPPFKRSPIRASEWISVKDCLPESPDGLADLVLTWDGLNVEATNSFNERTGAWMIEDDFSRRECARRITHWMPFPHPPTPQT